jgi:hypothetical protein
MATLSACKMPSVGSGLNDGGKVRPLLDTEGANIAHGPWEPRERLELLYRGEKVCHVLVVRHIQASLDRTEAVACQSRTDLGVA